MSSLKNKRSNIWLRTALMILVLLAANGLSQLKYFRFDLTSEKKYSISEPTKKMLRTLKDEVYVRVYLNGELPAGFTRLQQATRDMLNEFQAEAGPQLRFEFIDPMEGDDNRRKKVFQDLAERGLMPTNLLTREESGKTQKLIFPGALISYAGREVPVQLLENQIGFGPMEVLNHSEILLEYKLAAAIKQLSQYRARRIAFLSGHGELNEVATADFRQSLKARGYEVSEFDLRSFYKIPEKFDAVVIGAPTQPFDEKDKFKIDQYFMKGGHLLWLMETTNASLDSLRNSPTGQFSVGNELNLDDLLFRYGVRVNQDLLLDINLCNPIPLVVGMQGNAPQTELFPWYYFPLLVSDNRHPLSRNLDPVAARFCSSLDTIRRDGIRKDILLHTSKNSRAQLTPTRVHFGILSSKPNPAYFNQPELPVAVTLEGNFESHYKNRLSPQFMAASDSNPSLAFRDKCINGKMIVIGDGDIAKNDMRTDATAYPLGFYPFTRQVFANKDFLLNCMEYLTDSTGLLEARNKEVKLRLLDGLRAKEEKIRWQMINLSLPALLVILFGIGYSWRRRKKYGR